MKRTVREDYRVRVVISAESPRTLGLPVDGQIVSSRVEVVVEPKRLGDFGLGVMSDSLVSRNPQERYRQLAEDMARELRFERHVVSATVEFTETSTCSHCGYPWEEVTAADLDQYPLEGDELGLPVCCEQAQAEFRAAKAGAQ